MKSKKGKRTKNAKQHPKIASAKHIFGKAGSNKGYRDGDLTFQDFFDLSQQPCFYCGADPSNQYNKFKNRSDASAYAIHQGTFTYNGLDRIDNNKPHNKSNCVPCCWICNAAKAKMSIKEFKSWIKRVYKHLIQK